MPTARRRLADVAWLDQKMQLGFLRRKVASDLAERTRADGQPRKIQRRRVGGVVHLPPELEALVLRDPDILEQREIQARQARRGQDIPA